ncbi:hypothetical protein [Burkholderia ubonensis]|uniref:hypothetical protein n=1 Tax=Burkholderia ubonensis TaxID=101571 RepID=UPI000AB510AB|nr:hypothetical protein [Burkholderia ubonensis]
MMQNFSGDIGQVAGRDVKANNAQSNVSLHFHNAKQLRFISDRQRNAIARRALRIQVETGTDKLLVYRKLMTVFDLGSIDEMPASIYKRVILYLNSWLKNKWTDQTAAGVKSRGPASSHNVQFRQTRNSPEPATLSEGAHASQQKLLAGQHSTSKSTRPYWNGLIPWHAFVVVLTVIVTLVIVLNGNWSTPASHPVMAAPLLCEYGGYRYSLGSIVMQAGIRSRCVEMDTRRVTWQPLTDSKRR